MVKLLFVKFTNISYHSLLFFASKKAAALRGSRLLVFAEMRYRQTDDGGGKKENADPLRGRESEHKTADLVAPEKLERKAHDGVYQHIEENQPFFHDPLLE